MHLSHLHLVNYKNYPDLEINLVAGINGIVGPNGAGKTNILDAVYYLSMCKSYLNVNDRHNMRFDQSFFSIASQWQLDQKVCEVQVAYKAGVKKQVKWNKKAYDKLTAHIGNERGAALVEYALLVALIAVVCIGAITFLGNSADTKFSNVGSQLG